MNDSCKSRFKRRHVGVVMLLSLSLFSCAKQPFREFDEPMGGTYDSSRKFKESEPVDLAALGKIPENDRWKADEFVNYRHREDGCLNPFEGLTPADDFGSGSIRGIDKIRETFSHPEDLFDEKAYTYVSSTSWYVDIHDFEPPVSSYLDFYNYQTYQALIGAGGEAIGGPFLDAVYSHGQWCYIANNHVTSDENYRESWGVLDDPWIQKIFWCLKHCSLDPYPYTVYFDRCCFYFMTRSKEFPNNYIKEFNKREDMHLLYA